MGSERRRALPMGASGGVPDMNLVITIRGRDYDRRPRQIVVERETETDWYGWPVANGACPTLQWPKCAWEQVA